MILFHQLQHTSTVALYSQDHGDVFNLLIRNIRNIEDGKRMSNSFQISLYCDAIKWLYNVKITSIKASCHGVAVVEQVCKCPNQN